MGITQDEFNEAVTSCEFPIPPTEVYDAFISATSDFSRNELAQFLSQLIHDSDGFQNREELDYIGMKYHNDYSDTFGLPNKMYHGRGYILLKYGVNYKAASEALGLAGKLLESPELVAEDAKLAMDVSVWSWKNIIAPVMKDRENYLEKLSKSNGPMPCLGGFDHRHYKRYQCYLNVAKVLGVEDVGGKIYPGTFVV